MKNSSFVLHEGKYHFTRDISADELIEIASSAFDNKVQSESKPFVEVEKAARYIAMKIGKCYREVFACLFLDNRHRLIAFEKLFLGNLSTCTVHISVIARRALLLNASAIILCHNHPTGVVEPSNYDERVTKRIQAILELLEIKLLDHIIVSKSNDFFSFAKEGVL